MINVNGNNYIAVVDENTGGNEESGENGGCGNHMWTSRCCGQREQSYVIGKLNI